MKRFVFAILTIAILALIIFMLIPKESHSPSVDYPGKAKSTNSALLALEESIIGKWQSKIDSAYTVEYFDDRSFEETYDYSQAIPPEAPFSVSGTWQVIDDNGILKLLTVVDESDEQGRDGGNTQPESASTSEPTPEPIYVFEVINFSEDSLTIAQIETFGEQIELIRLK